jgi:HEAT repeat protein
MSGEQSKQGAAGAPTDPATVETLVEEMGHKDGTVREKARNSLVSMGAVVAPPLAEAAQAHEGRIRFESVKALSLIGDPGSIPLFVGFLRDKDSGVRWVAAEGLIEVGRPSVPAVLRALAEGPVDDWILVGAHHALKGLSGRLADLSDTLKPVIAACADPVPEDTLPPAAEVALRAIEGPGA